MMTSDIAAKQGSICSLFQKKVMSIRSSRGGNMCLTKVNSYCGIFKATHYKCDVKLAKIIDNYYNLKADTYDNDTPSPLLCMNCNEHCFHCDENTHQ